MNRLKHLAVSALAGWTGFVQKAGVAVLVVIFALAFFAVRYTVGNLSMNTDTEDLLSDKLVWRKLDQEYEKLFPQYDNNILIVVEAATPDQAQDAAELLYERLQPEQTLFEFVYYPKALALFRESGLLFLDRPELQDLSDNLAEVQPFLAKLARDPTLHGLFEVLVEALDALEDGEQIDLNPILTRINAALEALRDKRPVRMSWQELMSGTGSDEAGPPGNGAEKTPYREFILTQPKLDYGGLFPGTPAIEKIHQVYEDLDIAASPGADLRLTGATVLAHEEMLSVTKGTRTAAVLALCLVTVILLAGLGSAKLALVTVLSLVTGLAFTAAFATLTVGELNLISVAFAVLYIGLGVDFAIHFCLRYRERLIDGEDSGRALKHTSTSVGGSLFLCAASTAIGFFAFIPTDYTGVAELGWISGFGMFISFITTLTVIPALLSLLTLRPGPHLVAGASSRVDRHAGKILGGASFLALASALLLTGLRFDHNTLNLHDQDGAALATYRQLLADNDLSPWTAIMIAGNADEADRFREQFTSSDQVEKVLSVVDFIPEDQAEKLFIIDEMSLLLGDLSVAAQPDPATQTPGARLAALRAFQEKLQEAGLDDPIVAQLRRNLAQFLGESYVVPAEAGTHEVDSRPNPELRHAGADLRGNDLGQLEQALLASLPGRLDALNASLNADYISQKNLPVELKRLWLSANGHHRIEIFPKQNMQDDTALREFVRAIQAISPLVTGAPVINLEASEAVAGAFMQAFLYAFIAITLMLYLLLARKKDVFLVLIPLLTAAVITGGISVLAAIPLNFANVIALPLLLGIGVDSGIHIIHRFRTDLPDGKNILATSSARAVMVSSLTTMGGVGNLALSPHAGTASLGLLLTLGIGITLLCMLLVLPALLTVITRSR